MPPPPIAIDLGELPRGEPAERESGPPWPVRERLRWLRGRRGWRTVGVVLALALVAATGASSPLRLPLAMQLAIDQASVAFADRQNLYVVPDSGGPGEIVITAYRLEDGARRWETFLPGNPSTLIVTVQDGALLAYASPTENLNNRAGRTTRLDPDSGEPLWSHPGRMAGGDHGRLLLSRDTSPATDGEYPLRELTAADPATGNPEWTIETTAWGGAIAGDPPALVAMSPDGGLRSYDLASGEPLSGLAEEDFQRYPSFAMVAIGSVVLVGSFLGDHPIITAYEPASLRRRWMVTDLAATNVLSPPMACGPAICVRDGNHERALDPATGETIWSTAWAPAGENGYTEIYPPGVTWLSGQLAVTRYGEADEQASWLVDAETGAPVLDLGEWVFDRAFWWPAPAEAGPIPVLRRQPDGSTFVGELRPDLSGVDPLMPLETAEPDSCQTHPPYVVCGLTDGGFGRAEVWRVR